MSGWGAPLPPPPTSPLCLRCQPSPTSQQALLQQSLFLLLLPPPGFVQLLLLEPGEPCDEPGSRADSRAGTAPNLRKSPPKIGPCSSPLPALTPSSPKQEGKRGSGAAFRGSDRGAEIPELAQPRAGARPRCPRCAVGPCSHSFFLLDFCGAAASFSGSRCTWFLVRKRMCCTSCSMRQR